MNKKQSVWGKHYSWCPKNIEVPSTLEELRQAILKAKERHQKIRAVGSLHSLNDLCETDGTQILTDRLCKILSVDKALSIVTVEGGIKIKELLRLLALEGLTLQTQGYIVEQSIAGAIATATHGSGQVGTLSSLVEAIDLIDAQGDLHHLSPATDKDLFSAAVVSLGCLGIVYAVTLRCTPLQKLHLAKVAGHMPEVMLQLPELLTNNDYFQMVLDPYSDRMFSWQFRKTDESPKRQWAYQIHRLIIKGLAVISFDVLPPPGWLMPALLRFYMAISPMRSCVDYGYRLLSPADEGHYIEEEIAIPLEYLEPALQLTREIIDRYSHQGKRMVAIILVRFANADSYGYLSPTLNRRSAYISLITIAKRGYEELFKEFEIALYKYEGRPHWGKAHFLTKERVAALYPETYDLFVKAKRRLDPDGLFSNGGVGRIL